MPKDHRAPLEAEMGRPRTRPTVDVFRRAALVTALLLCVAISPPANAEKPLGLAVLGDSYSDEWSPLVPGSYNWVEQLVRRGMADLGEQEEFAPPDPRAASGRSYRLNFAVAGANMGHLLRGKPPFKTPPVELFNAAARRRRFDYGMLEISGNDLLFSMAAEDDAGWIKQPADAAGPKRAMLDMQRRYNEILDAATCDTDTKMVVATLCDLGSMPVATNGVYFAPLSTDECQNVRQNIEAWNDRIRAIAGERGYAVLDLWQWWEQIRLAPPSVAGRTIDVAAAMTADGVHPSIEGHALIAAALLEALAGEPYRDARAGQLLGEFTRPAAP